MFPAGNDLFWGKLNNFEENAFKNKEMQKIISIGVLLSICIGVLLSCAKYKSPKGYTDPQLTNHYCNDPLAVNYNWGFPGIPDNTVCFYPTDVFAGKYIFRDSIFLQSGYIFIRADSFIMTIKKINTTQMSVFGVCVNGDSLVLTATPSFIASVDTTEGDTVTNCGEPLCGSNDTINGTITQNRLDSVLTILFQVASDSGIITLHSGSATLIH